MLATIKAEKQKLIAERKIKKEKPLAPINPDDVPFALPDGLVWCFGSEIGEYIDPQPSHRTPVETKNGVPYVSMRDIDDFGKMNFYSARKVSNDVFLEHQNRYRIENGDFILGKIGTIGNPVWVTLPQDYTLSANVVLIQPNKKIVNPIMMYTTLSRSLSVLRRMLVLM